MIGLTERVNEYYRGLGPTSANAQTVIDEACQWGSVIKPNCLLTPAFAEVLITGRV